MPRSEPQVAQCEDYDSDIASTKPGTKREARRKTISSSRPPKALDRYRSAPRDIASDSGYSSRTSGTQASNVSAVAPPAPTLRTAPAGPSDPESKPKPILHRSGSQRSRDKGTSSRSGSQSGRREACRDLNCQHAECQPTRITDRRHSGSQQSSAHYAPQPAAPTQQVPPQQHPTYVYQYASVPQTPTYQTAVPLVTGARPRLQSTSAAVRPTSIHGYPLSGVASNPSSNNAYQTPQAAAWLQYAQYTQQQQWLRQRQAQAQAQQQQYQQQQAYRQPANYGTAAIMTTQPTYPQHSPITTSPTSPDFRNASTFQATYPYRPAPAPIDTSMQQSRPASSLRTYSARQASLRQAMPGAYPRDEIESSDYTSSSDYSEEERDRYHRPRTRDTRLSSSARRPSIKRTHVTAPVISTRSVRDHLLRRNPHSDTGLEYISSSDNMDSDRTACAVISQPRRSHTSSSRGSRRPSVSTTASSGRTKATTVSNTSGLANVTIERNGRHITYLSKRDRERYEHERLRHKEDRDRDKLEDLQEKVRAYQNQVRGSGETHPTSEDIAEHERQQQRLLQQQAQEQQQQQQQAGSHYSSHSRQDSQTSSAAGAGAEIKIVHGGNIVHLPPNTPIEMRQHDDGSSTLFIGSSSRSGRRDSKYYHSGSSRHSGKRSSRGYGAGGSEVDSRYEETILEDEGVEHERG